MLGYLLKRLLVAVSTLLAISAVIFSMLGLVGRICGDRLASPGPSPGAT